METEDAILGRRSVRDYDDREVSERMLKEILKAGAMAPSAMDRQPCRFIVIKDRKRIRELSDKVKDLAGALGFGARLAERMKLKEDVIFYGAPLLILIVAGKGERICLDCALAAQNMMLRAYDLGLGSCFIGFARLLSKEKDVLKGLGIKDGQELYCSLIFGHPKGWPHAKDRGAKVQKRIG